MAGHAPSAAFFCCTRSTSFVQRAQSLHAKRCFTTTSSRQKHGALPSLSTSESAPPELTELLQKIRRNIFLPAHLKRPLQNLIYQPRNHSVLKYDPVTVTLGEEDFVLEPLNVMRDVPDSWKSLLKAMNLMGTSMEDWRRAFPGLLEGFKTAGRKWKTWQWEVLLRRAGQRGMAGVLVEAARRAERTGLTLKEVRIVREAFWACRTLAMDGGREQASDEWEAENTLHALRYAEQIAGLMELEKHCGDAKFELGERDPRAQPDCMGILLELAALRAQKHLDGKDEDGKVRTYAERLVINLEKGLSEDMDQNEETNMMEGRTASAADYELLRWVPMANGLEVASVILGPEMPRAKFVRAKLKDLTAKIQKLGAQIIEAGEQAHPERRRGLKWLQDVEES